MKNPIRSVYPLLFVATHVLSGCAKHPPSDASGEAQQEVFPDVITVTGMALNPEGIEYDSRDQSFLLSSLNAAPITKVQMDGTSAPFTSGEAFPLSTAGLQIDAERGRLLVAALNGAELYDGDPETKGVAYLRVYDLDSGVIEQDINLSSLLPDAPAYMANDIAVDGDGNVYVSDWFAGVVYKVGLDGIPDVFWTNQTSDSGGPNGLDYHPDGYLLVSLVSVADDGTYSDYALVKVPLQEPSAAVEVPVSGAGFSGFDGMVLTGMGRVVGVTNNETTPGGNVLLELSAEGDWNAAAVERSTGITPSTTVAVTPENRYFVVNQDFSDAAATTWTIEQIELTDASQ